MELANVLQLLTHNPRSDSPDMTAHLRLLALALTACVPFLSFAQPDLKQVLPALPDGYELSVDTVVVHESGELAGYNTYRLYVECLHPLDFVVSCSGDENNPLLLASTSSEGWYNSALAAGWNAVAINELFFTAFPEMEFDSFLTIGADNSSYPSSMHPISVWGAIDAGLEFDQDGPGTNVLVNDEVGGSWFQTPPLTLDDSLTHPAFGGPEQRVLIAQITTPGRIYGQVQIQIFGEGENSNEFRSVLQIPFAGCNDPAACTFDPNATLNDGSCVYPSNGFDCFGNCVGTVDACGVCEGDGTSCLGCTDAAGLQLRPRRDRRRRLLHVRRSGLQLRRVVRRHRHGWRVRFRRSPRMHQPQRGQLQPCRHGERQQLCVLPMWTWHHLRPQHQQVRT